MTAMSFLTPKDEPFRSARFEVGTWQGVAVDGDHARAYVVGHTSYDLWSGGTRRTEAFQNKALLTRDANARFGWIVTMTRAAFDDTTASFDRG